MGTTDDNLSLEQLQAELKRLRKNLEHTEGCYQREAKSLWREQDRAKLLAKKLAAAVSAAELMEAQLDKTIELLKVLDQGGGLGLDRHEWLRAAIADAELAMPLRRSSLSKSEDPFYDEMGWF